MKRTPLKRGQRRRVSAAEREAMAEFHRSTVDRARCIVCGKTKAEARAAGTVLQAHHVLPKAALRKRGLDHLLWDPRNGAPVCESEHSNHTTRYKPISRSALPPAAEEFASEVGLGHLLEAQYA